MKKRVLLLFLTAACAAALLSGCKKNVGTPEDNAVAEEPEEEENEEESGRLFGYSCIDLSNPFFETLGESIQTSLEEQGDRLILAALEPEGLPGVSLTEKIVGTDDLASGARLADLPRRPGALIVLVQRGGGIPDPQRRHGAAPRGPAGHQQHRLSGRSPRPQRSQTVKSPRLPEWRAGAISVIGTGQRISMFSLYFRLPRIFFTKRSTSSGVRALSSGRNCSVKAMLFLPSPSASLR